MSSGARSAVARQMVSAITTSVSIGRWSPWSSSVAAGRSATFPAAAAWFTSGQLSFPNSYGAISASSGMCDQTDDVPRVERAKCAHGPQLAVDRRTQLLDWVVELVDEFSND